MKFHSFLPPLSYEQKAFWKERERVRGEALALIFFPSTFPNDDDDDKSGKRILRSPLVTHVTRLECITSPRIDELTTRRREDVNVEAAAARVRGLNITVAPAIYKD